MCGDSVHWGYWGLVGIYPRSGGIPPYGRYVYSPQGGLLPITSGGIHASQVLSPDRAAARKTIHKLNEIYWFESFL